MENKKKILRVSMKLFKDLTFFFMYLDLACVHIGRGKMMSSLILFILSTHTSVENKTWL